ncbi:L-type lectin-domain containing receptor kinase IV.1 [Zea mays]|uniref:non-specific serine/threonine protein kinase n=1 Tax=Zea mays TaxID=4577 RepID=A0A3L6E1L3_MAIZE|nr:L-type lectin-domain containing receptor kinase IV.1 [Zea mays]
MSAKLLSLVVLLLLIHVSVPSSSADVGHQFIYQGFAASDLALDGLAAVTPGGLLALTNATFQAKAHAFRPTPGLSDHGLAFVVAPTTRFSAAKAGQYLGILGAINGTASDPVLAVELDTILNPELSDIDSNHVGVDVNSLVSEQAMPAGYYDDAAGGALRELQLNSRKPMQVWIDYDGQAERLDVTLAPVRVPKPSRPLVSTAVDLSTIVARGGPIFGLDGPAPPLDMSKLPVLPRVGPKPRSKVLDVLLPLATALVVAAALAAISFAMWRRRRFAEVREDWEDEFGPHRFSYKDLFHATNGFDAVNLLGVGGFGRVYKGVLLPPSPGLEIAVKRVSHGSRQGVREFVAEVVSIGRIRHRNLVQLLGYCRRRGELILVYDYMANGSLDKYLYDQHVPALSWHERYRIIKGVAASLLYLHEDWEQVVIHRDVKASNVLLDHEMNGRLGDFGLARLYDHGTDPQTTHVVGTMGYLAPELVRTGKATPSTDVFSFGVFLLEVACGRRPIDRDRRVVLGDWVIEHHRDGSVLDVVDPRLVGKYEAEEATMVLKLGLMCAHPLPNVRPSMRRVVQYLDSDQAVPDLSPNYTSYSIMSLIHNDGFDSYITSSHSHQSHPYMTNGIGVSSASVLSQGR